jgi:hypothetical protein
MTIHLCSNTKKWFNICQLQVAQTRTTYKQIMQHSCKDEFLLDETEFMVRHLISRLRQPISLDIYIKHNEKTGNPN